MPWRPRSEPLAAQPRLSKYSHRVARLFDGPDLTGHLLVLPDVYWTQTGGALWWQASTVGIGVFDGCDVGAAAAAGVDGVPVGAVALAGPLNIAC